MLPIARLADRRRRLAVAGAVAVVSVFAAAVMHTVAGGLAPSIVAISLALVISLTLGTLVVGPRLTRRRAAAGVLLDQAVFHALFAFFGPDAMGTVPSLTEHSEHGMPALGIVDTAVVTPAPSASIAAMVLGHVAAAALAYGLLRRGAAALNAITAALRSTLSRVLDTVSPVSTLTAPLRLAASGIRHSGDSNVLWRLPDRRGPPAIVAL